MKATVVLLMGAAGACAAANSAALLIAEDGAATCAVVVATDAGPVDRYAADELVRFLGKVTGADIPLAFGRQAGKANLFVGPGAVQAAYPDISTDDLGDEGILIRAVEDDMIITGGVPRGALNAVYSFLEETVGCRWWAPGVSTIPRRTDLTVDAMDIRFVPKLEYRDPQFRTSGDWSARNKVNGFEQDLTGKHGGRKFEYIAHNKWSSHTFWTLLDPKIYFEDHPEYYSLIDGQRVHSVTENRHTSLCLTSEAMRKEFVQNCRLALAWHPWATLFSISQVDEGGGRNRCTCGPCTAVEEADEPAGLIIQFVNAVAAELKEEYPKVTFDTLAYHYSQKPPRTSRPRDDVIIRLSSIGCSFNTPFSGNRNDNPRHNQFREDLEGWAKVSNRLWVWDYAVNFTYFLPHPNLHTFGPNIRFLIDNHVTGILEEADVDAVELPELRAWLLAKLLWDPYRDTQALIEEFCHGYYGPAGEHIVAYLDVTHDAVETTGDYLNLSSPPDAAFLSFDTLNRCWGHLQAAAATVEGDPTLGPCVDKTFLPVMFACMYRWDELRQEAEEAGGEWLFAGTQRDLYEEIKQGAARHGIRLKGLSSPIPF